MEEFTISCRDCDKALMHYMVKFEDPTVEAVITASCPFCGGKSFEKVVKGLFMYGPISADESAYPTIVEPTTPDGNKIVFNVRKK